MIPFRTFRAPHAVALLLALFLAGCGDTAGSGTGHDDHARDREAGNHAHAAPDEGATHDAHDDGHGHDEAGDRTTIPADVAEASGIRVAAAGPGTIADEHEVQGLLTPVEGRLAHVAARFPGPVRQLLANVGDRVRAGQVLARVESNQSLTEYAVTAPISGVVLARNATPGAIATESAPLFEIADLSTLWVDLHVFGTDMDHIQPGAAVTVTRLGDGASVATTLERVLPGTATASQSTVARATIRNEDGLWRPGSAVRARITVAQQPAPLVVPLGALQTLDGREVAFVREGEDYLAHPLELGPRDARQVQVLSGLAPGDLVVVEQSYLIKADIGKAGAAHEH